MCSTVDRIIYQGRPGTAQTRGLGHLFLARKIFGKPWHGKSWHSTDLWTVRFMARPGTENIGTATHGKHWNEKYLHDVE